jgi:hypothetical protein
MPGSDSPIMNNGSNLPLVGQFFNDTNAGKTQDAMQQAQAAYEDYRPMQAQARMEGLQQAQQSMAPVQNALSNMYGPAGQLQPSDGKLPPALDTYEHMQAMKPPPAKK